jgi:hypothetical protein
LSGSDTIKGSGPPATNPRQDVWVYLGSSAAADPGVGVPDSTSSTQVGTRHPRLAAWVLPLAMAAAFAGTPAVRGLRRYLGTEAETPTVLIAWHRDEDLEDPILEAITNDQVRALNALLALPYRNDHEFDYFADE